MKLMIRKLDGKRRLFVLEREDGQESCYGKGLFVGSQTANTQIMSGDPTDTKQQTISYGEEWESWIDYD